MAIAARCATVDDSREIVRLAEIMYASMGIEATDQWREAAARSFATRLGADIIGFVVNQPD
ncbi:MAG: hypothetical protein JXA67_01650 [Micromonosporaceae bacterium]|nr:hypothetical protein [Micromonosporaceae bacterium]